ncbi:hypothetical protein C1645_732400 [Glomus cerebriforme]|uniref:Uncharacterized protein n=1 Tax=Glomus cerebriforme TaxID=658196 RepID=A0A397TJM8_9GLOM|nr:hypothetical protein C1645_732400 [Glomus cerebriforme]
MDKYSYIFVINLKGKQKQVTFLQSDNNESSNDTIISPNIKKKETLNSSPSKIKSDNESGSNTFTGLNKKKRKNKNDKVKSTEKDNYEVKSAEEGDDYEAKSAEKGNDYEAKSAEEGGDCNYDDNYTENIFQSLLLTHDIIRTNA